MIHELEDLVAINQPLHLALGVFDGVHIGHLAVIGEAVAAAREHGGVAGVLTFDPHPIRILAPQVAPSRILASLNHKKELLSAVGVEVMVVVPFTQEFAKVSAIDFLTQVKNYCPHLQTMAMGADWKFGNKRSGDVALLEKFGKENSVRVRAVNPVMLDGERVSSTRIRQAIRDGNLTAAAGMLGRDYTVLGTVISGRQLGRTLGFPTANLRAHNEQLPPDGVWAVEVTLADGKKFRGAGNLGVRPTVEGEEAKRMLEVHLLGFEGDLYGQDVEVKFLHYVRGERKFDSLDALKRQIAEDVNVCKNVL
ncbi:MAG: bifunctional riboflavin kinase/FAD synthetase [Akkermansiaceae bacterium]